MPVGLPAFDDSYGLILTACGRIVNPADGGIRAGIPTRVARYQTPRGRALVRTSLTGKEKPHLHVDCALEQFFSKDRRPKVTHKKAEAVETMLAVEGCQIATAVEAGFRVPMDVLPESGVIRTLAAEQRSVDVSFRLSGGELSIRGAALKAVRWTVRGGESGEVAHIWMKGSASFVVSDRYLCDCWDWIWRHFSVFVLGRRSDGAGEVQ